MRKKWFIFWALAIVLALFLNFFQLPIYVTTPGNAMDLSPMVKVENGTKDAEGSFMLTTVLFGKASILKYAIAKTNKYHKIFSEEQMMYHGESLEDYHKRQLYLMDDSRKRATYIAFKSAGKEVELLANGVYVTSTFKGMPAEKILKVGDRIILIDDKDLKTSEEMIQYVSRKKAGDIIRMHIIRNEKEMDVEVPLVQYKTIKNKVGIGISLYTDKIVKTKENVTFNTEDIEGPSAGFMLTLEVYNQLVDEDITKGYEIAGTGTMEYDGSIGPIGGVDQKVVAAHNAGADIFFAPNEKGAKDSDYRHALITAKDIKTRMKIVPVDTFDDALNYLDGLEEER